MGYCVASRVMVFAFISRDKIVDSATHIIHTHTTRQSCAVHHNQVPIELASDC